MYKHEIIAEHECNCIYNKAGTILRRVTIMVGDANHPGARVKDGSGAKMLRRASKLAVMAATGLDQKFVRCAARYSCLHQQANGPIARRDAAGHIIGVYLP